MTRVRWLVLGLGAVVVAGCCDARLPRSPRPSAATPGAAAETPVNPNQQLLAEVNARREWSHYRKTRPIWARRVATAESIVTLEGPEQVPAGAFVCRGEAGDLWAQSELTLLKRYVATDEFQEGWQRYRPHPDAEGVMAIPVDHAFEVQATWGRLRGKPGDFLLKNFADRDNGAPQDVWIVDQTLFRQTYEPVGRSGGGG